MNWPNLILITGAAAACYASGFLGGWCAGRYGWRQPVPLPTVFRRRPADIWRHQHAEAPGLGVTVH